MIGSSSNVILDHENVVTISLSLAFSSISLTQSSYFSFTEFKSTYGFSDISCEYDAMKNAVSSERKLATSKYNASFLYFGAIKNPVTQSH